MAHTWRSHAVGVVICCLLAAGVASSEPGAIDAILIRNAYHEMPEYRGVLAGVTRALKPGGTLIVIEAIHDNIRAKTRAEQVKEHEIAPEIVESELREAGFEIVERQDSFTTFTRPPPGGFWMIRARRPA